MYLVAPLCLVAKTGAMFVHMSSEVEAVESAVLPLDQ